MLNLEWFGGATSVLTDDEESETITRREVVGLIRLRLRGRSIPSNSSDRRHQEPTGHNWD